MAAEAAADQEMAPVMPKEPNGHPAAAADAPADNVPEEGDRQGETYDNRAYMHRVVLEKVYHVDLGDGALGLKVNPLVSITAATVIWVFIIFAIAMPDRMLHAMNTAAFEWIPEIWTWLYIVSQDIWIVVLLYVCIIGKYGNLKFGKDDEEPEFSFATWFSMLFSAGVAIGLFYYSVAEPLWHFEGSGNPRWQKNVKGYGNSNEDAIHAIMVTWYHWGIHGWIPYTTMGAVIALMTYRRGFPMTIRYCFWPLLGDRVFGVLGDAVDALSIVTTLFGVCTSLGLGAMQINQGLQRLNHGFYRGTNYEIENVAKYANPTCGGTGQTCENGQESYGIQTNVINQILIICCVTLMATISVISGVGQGIKNLSRFNFGLGMFLLLMVLFMGETWYCLDTVVQTFGYYMWYILKISFQTDALERLGSKAFGLGGAPDDLGGSGTWLAGWTIFYWGWWISWGPFVGTFLARISKGRTLRQFVIGTLILPSLYSFLWFGIMGAEGIRMQRMADASGLCDAASAANTTLCSGGHAYDGSSQISGKCSAYSAQYSVEHKRAVGMGWNPPCILDPDYHDGYGRCKDFEWSRMVVVGDTCVRSTSWVDVPCGGVADPTSGSVPTVGPCAYKGNDKDFNHFPLELQYNCFVPLQAGVVCLYNQGTTDIFFDLLASYTPRGFSDLMAVISMVALTLYFVTSSDSGSYVIDVISANGLPDPPVVQRIFWSVTEGATACALLAAGRNLPNAEGSLRALQSASLVMGLPYTFVLFWCSQSLLLLCKEEAGEIDPKRKAFNTFIFDFFPLEERLWALGKNTLLPGFTMGRIVGHVGGWPSFGDSLQEVAPLIWGVLFQTWYLTVVIFLFCGFALYEWVLFGLCLYLGFGTLLGFMREQVRQAYQIKHSDLFTDVLCGIFVPMFTLTQIESQMMGTGKVAVQPPGFDAW
mmetsp:Transcript_29904/g.69564  ORF Transcript_29904/g.69564 Transcript_29904/m.69564 type:complete len:930 (+) Transcript_29904:70-2859(+)